MASFDFINAAAKGYEFSWYERSYLLRALIPVLLVKLACILVLRFMNIEDQSLLGGLVSMPAHVIEAIIMVSVVRFIAFREPLFEFQHVIGHRERPEISDEGKAAVKQEQKSAESSGTQMFKAGVAMYLLIKIVQLGFVGLVIDYSKALDPSVRIVPPEQNLANALIFMVIAGVMLWAFRLLWLYIPLAMGYSVRGFLLRIKGMMSSMNIFATWFVCYFPLLVLISGVFMVSNFMLVSDSIAQVFVHDVLRVFGESLITLVQIIAMTFGFMEVLTQHNKKKK